MEKVRIDYESLKSQLERDHSGLTSEIKDYKDVVKMQKEALDLVTGTLSWSSCSVRRQSVSFLGSVRCLLVCRFLKLW